MNIHKDWILIIDFGSQTTQLIARRVRELGVFCKILPYDYNFEFNETKPKGIILSGGPSTVTKDNTPRISQKLLDLNLPILGICYGMQALTQHFGGEVVNCNIREFGHSDLNLDTQNQLFQNIDKDIISVWMSHGDQVAKLPQDFKKIADTSTAPFAAIANSSKNIYGVQFHPEVEHTSFGKKILENFIINICGADKLWQPENIIAENIEKIKKQVGDDKVLLALSGGVDSSVVAAMLNKAIGKNLVCVFVDNGLLRHNEADQVMNLFKGKLDINLIKVDARELFLNKLKDISDPEQKRKIIGNLFIEVFDKEAEKLQNIKWLAQGTIYPDVVESAGTETGKSDVIKSHHNVGGLPEKMNLKLLEPLRELFKDEVRQVGLDLGLPADLVYRHPFPGPGLAVRVIGDIKEKYLDILRRADHIFIEELRKADLYEKVSQAFVVFLPIKSVAVLGDARAHEYVVSLRAVVTNDFMTATYAYLDHEFLAKVANRIINEIKEISRVTYDISSKPPATIEWE